MRPSDSYHAVGESLQADVMRFMAIIAFCLIAILALVRSVEPPVLPTPEPRASVPEPVPASPAAAPPASAPADAAPADATPAPTSPAPEADMPRPPEMAQQPDAPAAPAPQPAPAPQQAADEGLSLRFASDRDFLRLVNRGGIRVFVFNDTEVLALGTDFRFQPAAAPGAVHELLPETIPDLVVDALGQAAAPADHRWGIAMPERMAAQIRGYLESGASGQLVIDRFGEVRLHEA